MKKIKQLIKTTAVLLIMQFISMKAKRKWGKK